VCAVVRRAAAAAAAKQTSGRDAVARGTPPANSSGAPIRTQDQPHPHPRPYDSREMASQLGRPSVPLPIASGTFPARGRQPPHQPFTGQIMADDVFNIHYPPPCGHWYFTTPLKISGKHPQTLSDQEHEFSFLRPAGAAMDADYCACCNTNELNWDLPTDRREVATFSISTTDTLKRHLVPGTWTRGAATRSRFQRAPDYNCPERSLSPAQRQTTPAPPASDQSGERPARRQSGRKRNAPHRASTLINGRCEDARRQVKKAHAQV
jgi:hypothetical protein